MLAWDELFLRQRTNGTECSLVAGVEVQVGGANESVQEKSHYMLKP